ncbi:MAG TPA: RDD family protein [Actinocatenispora sp.]
MSKSIAPGWYKDPAAPETQRYWDGEQWLGDPLPAEAAPPATPPRPAPPPPPPPPVTARPDEPPSGWLGGTPEGQTELLRPGTVFPRPVLTMPSGFTGASLERRLGARVIDFLVVGALCVVANSWLGYRYLQIFLPYLREAMANPEDQPPIDSRLSSLFYVMVLISLVLWFAYEVVSTGRNGQTFGKRLLRIKVIRMDGAAVDFGSSFRRWAIMAVPNLFFPCCVPIQAVDALWCTWDKPLAQCIHDKSARTVVVSAKPADLPPAPDVKDS